MCNSSGPEHAPFPDLKLDTFPVHLEARIEPWLEREAHSQFSVRRLEMAQFYPSGDPQRPLSVQTIIFKGFAALLQKVTRFDVHPPRS